MTVTQPSATSYKKDFFASGLVLVDGSCVIQFPEIPAGSYATGTVTIFDSPPSALWLVQVNGVTRDQVIGAASTAGIQIGPGDILQFMNVAGPGLLAFAGNTYHGTFDSIISPENGTNLITTAHDPLTVTQQGVAQGIYLGTVIAAPLMGSEVQIIPVPNGISVIGVFVFGATPTNSTSLTVEGTNTQYTLINTGPLATGHSYFQGVFPSGIDPSATVTLSNGSGGVFAIAIVVGYTVPPADMNISQIPGANPSPPQQVAISGQPIEVTGDRSNAALYVTDNYGAHAGVSAVNVGVGASSTAVVLAAPAAGTVNRILGVEMQIPTAAAGVTFSRVFGTTSGAFLIGSYAGANGTYAQSSFDLPITEGISATNATTTAGMGVNVFYRNEPIV